MLTRTGSPSFGEVLAEGALHSLADYGTAYGFHPTDVRTARLLCSERFDARSDLPSVRKQRAALLHRRPNGHTPILRLRSLRRGLCGRCRRPEDEAAGPGTITAAQATRNRTEWVRDLRYLGAFALCGSVIIQTPQFDVRGGTFVRSASSVVPRLWEDSSSSRR